MATQSMVRTFEGAPFLLGSDREDRINGQSQLRMLSPRIGCNF